MIDNWDQATTRSLFLTRFFVANENEPQEAVGEAALAFPFLRASWIAGLVWSPEIRSGFDGGSPAIRIEPRDDIWDVRSLAPWTMTPDLFLLCGRVILESVQTCYSSQ